MCWSIFTDIKSDMSGHNLYTSMVEIVQPGLIINFWHCKCCRSLDRGVLKTGLKADINIIDWENVGSSDPFMTQDLPAGGKRLMQTTRGYVATIVSGNITYRNGVSTKERPGGLVRSVKDSQKIFDYTSWFWEKIIQMN